LVVEDHFRIVPKLIEAGSGARRGIHSVNTLRPGLVNLPNLGGCDRGPFCQDRQNGRDSLKQGVWAVTAIIAVTSPDRSKPASGATVTMIVTVAQDGKGL
jgi:hypothetical protein